MTQIIDHSTEPTTASAVAERISSNINLLHAQILEAIGEQEKRLEALRRAIKESAEQSNASIRQTCEIANQIHSMVQSCDATIEELRELMAREIT